MPRATIQEAVDDNYLGRKIKVYINGDPNFPGRGFDFCPAKFPTMDSFFDDLARRLGTLFTITKLYTVEGRVVTKLAALKEGGEYVASDGKRLDKEINYGGRAKTAWGRGRPKIGDPPLPPIKYHPIQSRTLSASSSDDGYSTEEEEKEKKRSKKSKSKSRRKESSDEESESSDDEKRHRRRKR